VANGPNIFQMLLVQQNGHMIGWCLGYLMRAKADTQIAISRDPELNVELDECKEPVKFGLFTNLMPVIDLRACFGCKLVVSV